MANIKTPLWRIEDETQDETKDEKSLMSFSEIQWQLEPDQTPALAQFLQKELNQEYPARSKSAGRRFVKKGQFQITVAEDEISGHYFEPSRAESSESIKFRLQIPFDSGHGGRDDYTLAQCDCVELSLDLEAGRCGHLFAAQNLVFEALQADLLSPQAKLPSWQNAFEEALNQKASPLREQRRLVWVVAKDLNPQPFLQSRSSPEHPWSLGQKIPWQDFASQDAFWLDEISPFLAARILPEPITIITDAMRSGSKAEETSHWDAYGALSDILERGSGTIRLSVHGEPIALAYGEPGLALTATEGGYLVQVTLSGQRLRPYRFQGSQGHRPAALIGLTVQGDRLWLARLSAQIEPIIKAFISAKVVIPEQDQNELFRYFSKVEEGLLLHTERILPLSDKGPLNQLVMRLEPLPGQRLKVELKMRIVLGGRVFAIGEGPEEALDFTDPRQPQRILRDKNAERQIARRALKFYQLEGLGEHHSGFDYLLHQDLAWQFLSHLQDTALAQGIQVEWPKSKVSTKAPPPEDQKPHLVFKKGEKDWFDLQIEIDGEQVDLEEVLRVLRHQRKFIQLKNGSYQKLTTLYHSYLKNMQQRMGLHQPGPLRPLQVISLAEQSMVDSEESSGFKILWPEGRPAMLAAMVHSHDQFYQVPDGLKATLRSYQADGFSWMRRLYGHAPGCCLADDMGLGKTIQGITLLLEIAGDGPSLIVCPKSMVPSWLSEMGRFAPSLLAVDYQSERSLAELGPRNVVVASYGLILSDQQAFSSQKFQVMLIDEAQMIKNHQGKTWQALAQVEAVFKVSLTGTPIENRLSELWSVFHLVFPELLGDYDEFHRQFIQPIEGHGHSSQRQLLQRILRPFMLRRLKKDFLKDLPPRSEMTVMIDLSAEERQLYDALRWQALQALPDSSEEDLLDIASQGESKAVGSSSLKLSVLSALNDLRLCACHPQLVDASWEGPSSKLMALLDCCDRLHQGGHKALIFSQFVKHLELISLALNSRGFRLGLLTGAMSGGKRQEAVAAFKRGEIDFFLISLKAGGTGLTLTDADYVIHTDPWWNPASEDQASDRIYRIGQDKPVTIYRFIVRQTVEEKIMALHAQKRQLAQTVLPHSIDQTGV